MINVFQYCNSFYHANYIPISYYNHKGELLTTIPAQAQSFKNIFQKFEEKVDLAILYVSGFSIFFKINLEKSNGTLILGPFCTDSPTSQELNNFFNELDVIFVERKQLEQVIRQIPITSINQSIYILDQVYTALKQKQINIFELFGLIQPTKQSIQEDLTDQLYDAKEEARYHNTYYFEKRINQAITSGNSNKLHNLLVKQDQTYHAGQLSTNKLRQLKNIFITTTTLAVRAAIEGGLSIEKAYQLSDIYINDCERLSDEVSIYGLTYTMYMDFVRRVADSKSLSNLSQPVKDALDYIQNHTNTPLTVQMVADHVGFSYSFFSKQFKNETNKTINEAILEAKIEEAKDLLAYTDKPISHISSYLAFSSQSYFQNQFKKVTGCTPLQYRKAKQ